MANQKSQSAALPDLREEIEPGKRDTLAGWSIRGLSLICIAFGLFQFYTAGTRPMLAMRQYAIHLAFAVAIIFWAYPFQKSSHRRRVPVYDLAAIAVALVAAVYIMVNALPIMEFTYIESNLDLLLGVPLLLIVLEASRRTLGLVFPILVSVSVLYALFGQVIPGRFSHDGFSWEVIIRNLYVSPQGFWGVMLQISATILAIFLIFGAVLLKSGGGEAFLNVAFLASARTRGGPAKVAAVASGLFGMISGSAVANAATIGTFTIPLMKRAGFSKEFAAATEAVAGTGGQIMPPIMGAGAFLIAEFLGISYARVAWAAVLPALLYYAGLIVSIHLEAVKNDLPTIPMEEERLIRASLTPKKVILPLIPVAALVYAFSTGYTVQMGAYWACILALVLTLFMVKGSPGQRFLEAVKVGLKGMEGAGKAIAEIAVLLASAQIIVSMLGLTGLAVKFSDLLVSIGRENMIATLVLAMIVLFILGMGIPPTAVYVLGGSIVVPALIALGLKPLPAHLFTFYFACLGAITPPVCAAVYVTSSLAESNWWVTGWLATRLGIAGFIVPFMFVYNDSLLLSGTLFEIMYAALPAVIGVCFLATFAVGYFGGRIGWVQRFLMAVAGVFLIQPGIVTDLVGIAMGGLIYVLQKLRVAKKGAASA
ncbi:MAG: transporter permease DctM/Q [candidate division NC10 bacterium]|jgi:TRAP transporter 4TM/12TM fusion protein|nr:transporter permease DctM/Q [candidate division NC10 bacterium]